MKKIFRYFSIFVLLTVAASCFKTEDEQMQSFKEGAVLATVTPISTVYIISDLENSYASFAFDTIEGDYSDIIVNVNHRRLNISGIVATYTIVPEGEIIYTASEIVSALSLTLDSLESTDEIVFSIAIKSTSGVEASSPSSSFKTIVACPSNIAGTYSVVASGSSTDPYLTSDESIISGFESEVTLTAINAYQYEISDFSCGLYYLWYNILYGVEEGDSPGTIQDICGEISFFNTYDLWGAQIYCGGSVNPEIGVIKLSAENDYGDIWNLTLTPVN
jgi:hypothetical protein